LRRHDLLFLAEKLMSGVADVERAADRIGADQELLEKMLDDERLFRHMMEDEEILLHVSPWLFFTVLLRRARRDLEREAFTLERRSRQKILIFDIDRVIELLSQLPVQEYLASLLTSFVRIPSFTVPVRVREGVWRRYRTHGLDVEGLMRYCQTLEEPFRFESYKRIADACLFLAGMYPEHIEAQYRYPLSQQVRPHMRGRVVQRLEDYEAHGRAFYQLAAEHEQAGLEGLNEVLATLSRNFILAEKPLTFIAKRYIHLNRHRLFEL
jgi:hypothetical protein